MIRGEDGGNWLIINSAVRPLPWSETLRWRPVADSSTSRISYATVVGSILLYVRWYGLSATASPVPVIIADGPSYTMSRKLF